MAQWNKILVSGSNIEVNDIIASGNVTFTNPIVNNTNGNILILSGSQNIISSVTPENFANNLVSNVSSFTQGSIIFADSDGSLTENNTQLYWDNVNNRLGIGTTTPSEKFEVNEGFILSNGSSIYHGFELARDSFPTYQIKHLDGGLTIYNSTDNRKEMSFFGDGRVGINGGNVGIGTISPTEKLEVNEGYIRSTGLSTSHGFELARDNSPTYQIKHLDGGLTIFNLNVTRKEMTFKGNGRIGINNSNPIETLDVIGNIKADGILKLYDVTDTQTIELNPDGNSYINSGNVGIGTSSPSELLHLFKEGSAMINVDSGATSPFISGIQFIRNIFNRSRIYNDGSAVQLRFESDFAYDSANPTRGGFLFRTSPVTHGTFVDAFRIDARGNVGIGTTNPTKNLHITDTEFTTIKLSSDTTGNTENDGTDLFLSGIDFVIHNRENGNIRFFTNLTERFKITNNGDIGIGIGSNNPTEKLDVNGNIKADGILKLFDITNTQTIELNPDGDSYINSGFLGIGTSNPYMRLHVGSGLVSTLLHNGKYLDTSASAKFVSDTPYVRNGILIGVNDGNRNSRLELYTKDDIAGNGEHGIRTGYSSGGQQPFRIYNNSSDAAFEIDSVGQRVKLPYYGLGNVTGTSTQILGVDSDGGILEESVDTFQRIEKLSGTLTNSFVTIKTLSLSTMDMYKMVVIGLGPDITLRQAALATYVARVEADGGVVESQNYVEVELGDLLDSTNYIRSYAEYLIYNEDGVGYALEELNSNLRSDQFAQPLININVDALQIKNGLNINNSTYRITLTKYD